MAVGAGLFCENIKMNFHFLLFLNAERVWEAEIIPQEQ